MPLIDKIPRWLRYAIVAGLVILAVAQLWGVGPFDSAYGYLSTAFFLLAGFILSHTNQPVVVGSKDRDSPATEILSYMLLTVTILGAWILAYSSGIFEGRLHWNFGTKLGFSLVMTSIIANIASSRSSGRR